MRIKVTNDDIENGIRMDNCECPIALAVKSQYPDAKLVDVALNRIVIVFADDRQLNASLPEIAKQFILAFDGEDFESQKEIDHARAKFIRPFEFEV